MSYTQDIFIYLNNIPASESKPFTISTRGVEIFKSVEPIDQAIIGTKVEEGKFASICTFYAHIKIPEKDIDELKEFNITNRGQYISLEYDDKLGLIVKQRTNDKWGDKTSGNEYILEDKFDYSQNALDPKLSPNIVTRYRKAKSKTPENIIYFHLANLEASPMKPCQIFVDGELIFTLKEDMPLNKERILEVELEEPKAQIEVKFKMMKTGHEAKQKFNLKEHGHYIQLALIDDNVRVMQRSDNKFPKLPFQFAKKKKPEEEEEEEQNVRTSGLQVINPQTAVRFYLSNIQATAIKKFIIKVDGRIVHRIEKNIPSDQVVVVEGRFPRPEKGDHIIKLSILAPAMGFYEPAEEEFNLDKHGTHIKIEIQKEVTGNESKYQEHASIAFDQAHKPFNFDGTVEDKPVVQQEKAKVPPKALKSLVNRSKQAQQTKTETQPTTKTETQPQEQSSNKTLSDLEALEKLAKLRDLGILTEEEFVQKKMQLLGL